MPGYDKQPYTARQLISALQCLPPDALVTVHEYDIDIAGTYIYGVTGVAPDGRIQAGGTTIDEFISYDDESPEPADDSGPIDSVEYADWELELLNKEGTADVHRGHLGTASETP